MNVDNDRTVLAQSVVEKVMITTALIWPQLCIPVIEGAHKCTLYSTEYKVKDEWYLTGWLYMCACVLMCSIKDFQVKMYKIRYYISDLIRKIRYSLSIPNLLCVIQIFLLYFAEHPSALSYSSLTLLLSQIQNHGYRRYSIKIEWLSHLGQFPGNKKTHTSIAYLGSNWWSLCFQSCQLPELVVYCPDLGRARTGIGAPRSLGLTFKSSILLQNDTLHKNERPIDELYGIWTINLKKE